MTLAWPTAHERGHKGLQVPLQKVRVINRATVTLPQGSVEMFDLAQTGDTANYTQGGNDLSCFVNTVRPTNDIGGLMAGWYCISFSDTDGVVATGIVDNAEYIGVIRGVTTALVNGGNDAAIGDYLIAQTAADNLFSDAAAASQKYIGVAMAASTGGGGAELIDILFNGIEGFGAADSPDTT